MASPVSDGIFLIDTERQHSDACRRAKVPAGKNPFGKFFPQLQNNGGLLLGFFIWKHSRSGAFCNTMRRGYAEGMELRPVSNECVAERGVTLCGI
jgi:hypothetical protein